MNNNSSQNRFAKITAKVIGLALVALLAFSVLPTLSVDMLPEAVAAEENYTVPEKTSAATISEKLATYAAGTVVNVYLSESINFTDISGDEYSDGITGIKIPENITVNLFMNNKSIEFVRESGGAYKLPYVYGIHNLGTLNVYSGANTTALAKDASIKIVNVRTDQTCNNKEFSCFQNLEGIRNEGVLTVNGGVNITVKAHNQFGKTENSSTESITNGATAIYNTADASCSVTNATLNVTAYGKTIYNGGSGSFDYSPHGDPCNTVAVAYGIYGGSITVSSTTSITVSATADSERTTTFSNANSGKSTITGIAFGIASNKDININSAKEIKATTTLNSSKATTDPASSMNLYAGGVFNASGAKVSIPDATITVGGSSMSYDTDDHKGGTNYYEGTVVAGTKMLKSATEIVSNNKTYNGYYESYHSGTISAGVFYDEAGNSYTTDLADSRNTHPTNMIRGALDGKNRVHIVYRYWIDENRSAIDTTIVGNDGNVGYSYIPLNDETGVVDTPVNLKYVTSAKNFTKDPSAAIEYISGGESCNSYYWSFLGLSYAQTPNNFSDYSVTSTANRGTYFKTNTSQGAQNTATPVVNGPIYIFVDYGRLSATSIKAKVGTSGIATTTYTGNPVKAGDIGLKILDSVFETDYTSEYDINFTDSTIIPVSFSYTGTNAAGVIEESSKGQLPSNAGTYEVTMTIDEATTYTQNPKLNKNRYGLTFKFTLVIEQASILRGNLPDSWKEVVYGQKLNQAFPLQNYTASVLPGDSNVAGVFSFTNATDGNTYLGAGEHVISVTWNPNYSGSAVTKNYKATTFNVRVTIAKAPLTIKPNAAAVTYGEAEFTIPFSLTVTGLVANDTVSMLGEFDYMVAYEGNHIFYSAGEIPAGSYSIRATFKSVPKSIDDNYDWSYVYGSEKNPEGVLTVAKRALKLEATAVSRAYNPTDFYVTVNLAIKDGVIESDTQTIRVSSAQGELSNNNAGIREVGNINKDSVANCLAGSAAGSYYIAEVSYNTGSKLLVTIDKAVPDATTPVVAEMFYQNDRTLSKVSLTGSSSSVDGVWQWVDATITPSVKVATYKAQFVPTGDDKDNYEIKTVDVAINVKPTPVIISYSGSVSYGDNVPNITAYTYKADLDPNFNIDKVTTSGNITPRTTYVKGSPVVAGGYAVEISAPNFVDVDGNYTFTTENGVITVNPRNIEFKVENTSIGYGENFAPNSSTVKVTYDEKLLVGTDTIEDITAGGTEPTFEYSTDFRYIDNYKVGTYTLKATPNFATSPNYTVSSTDGKLIVTKAELVIKADDITLEYGSAIPSDIGSAFEVVGAKRNEGVDDVLTSGAIRIDTTYIKGAPVNIDGYPVTVDISNAVFNNYTVTVQHGNITVIKATPKVTALPNATIVHGQTLGDAVFEGGTIENNVAGKFVYDSVTTSPAYRAEAYTIYTATFVPADTVNYNTVKGLYVSLTVGLRPVSGALSVTGIPMVGEKLTVDVSGLDPDTLGVYTFTWYNSDNIVVGTGKELTLTEAHKLDKLTIKAVANAPYTTADHEVKYTTTTIAPELTSVEAILNAESFDEYFSLSGLEGFGSESNYVYNAQPHYVEFNRNINSLSEAAIGGVSVKYNGSTDAPTNVGYYTITIDVATPSDVDLNNISVVNGVTTVNGRTVYSPIANYKIGTLVITPASYYVEVEVLDKVYDGTGEATAKVLTETGACEINGGYDDVSFDADSAVYYFANNAVGVDKDVFVNNAVLKGEAADNYELTIELANEGKADITKRTLKIKVNPVEREYEEKNYYVDLSFETVGNTIAAGDEGLVYVNEALVQGAVDNYRAGLRNVTVSGAVLTGSKASNYELELTNLDGLKVQILKATPGYPLPMTDTLYYDSARTLKSISLGDSRWAWDSSVINDVPGAGTHTFKAIYTPDDTLNYATVEYDVELEILRTTVTITAANFSVTYGDTEPTYYYTVTGLTGADTIKDSVDGYVLMNCSYTAGSDVGDYYVVLTGAFESDNYNFIYNKGKVTVGKRAAYVEAIAESREYEQGNTKVNVSFSALTNLYGTDAKNVYIDGASVVSGKIENDTAGTKTVKYDEPILAGSKAMNYELRLLNPTLTVEIKKAVIEGVKLPSSGIVDYGQKLNSTIFTSSYEGFEYGTFSMENPTSTPENVGTFSDVYKVVFTPYNTTNYATISEYITLTVNPAQLNIVISLTGTVQAGKSLYVLTNDIPVNAGQYLYYEWYRVNSADDDYRTGVKVHSGAESYYTLTEGDSGKYIICTVKNIEGSPYECFASCITDVSVEEESLTFWQKLVNWFYRLISNFTQIFGKLGG